MLFSALLPLTLHGVEQDYQKIEQIYINKKPIFQVMQDGKLEQDTYSTRYAYHCPHTDAVDGYMLSGVYIGKEVHLEILPIGREYPYMDLGHFPELKVNSCSNFDEIAKAETDNDKKEKFLLPGRCVIYGKIGVTLSAGSDLTMSDTIVRSDNNIQIMGKLFNISNSLLCTPKSIKATIKKDFIFQGFELSPHHFFYTDRYNIPQESYTCMVDGYVDPSTPHFMVLREHGAGMKIYLNEKIVNQVLTK